MRCGTIVVLYNPTDGEISNLKHNLGKTELSIIIDNSKQSNYELVKNCGKNVKYFNFKSNIGLCKALNYGIQELLKDGCEWAFVLDADSVIDNNILNVYKNYISKDTNYVCDILKSVFKWLIIFNFISIIIFPNGMYYDAVRDFPENYFLGFKNQHIYYFLAYFVFDFKDNVMTIHKKFDFKEVIIDVMMLLSSFISGATTSFFILIIIIIMKKLIVKISAINPVFMLFISFGVSIFLVLSSFQKSIVNSLDMYFGKDGSLFHRTSIWKMSILCIAKSPVWGNGNIDVPLKWSWDVGQCHNKYIDLLFVGGIIYFIVYLIFVLIACHDARILSKKFNLNIFSFALYGLFILYIVEANRTEFVSFTIFALIHYLKRTLNNKTNDKFLRKARYE